MKRLLFSLLLIAISLSATTINVPGDQGTIQAGIDTAVDGDTVLVQPGTYVETLQFDDKNIILASLFLFSHDTSDISSTIIDANMNGTVISFPGAVQDSSKIIGLSLINGSGGGVSINGAATPYLSHLIIRNNRTNHGGGGIKVNGTTATIENCRIENNEGGVRGGGILLEYSDVVIQHTQFSGNYAEWDGSAISCLYTSVTLSNVTIISDYTDASALFCWASNPVMDQMTFITNSDAGTSAIDLISDSHPVITNSILTGNTLYQILLEPSCGITVTNTCIRHGWEGEGNFDAIPMFCDPGQEQFTLAQNSPCANAGSMGGFIGAWPVGCDSIINITPGISEIEAQRIPGNTTSAPIYFTVWDGDTDSSQLNCEAWSSDERLVPRDSMRLFGEGSEKYLIISPKENQCGSLQIRVGVNDGITSDSVSFMLTVEQFIFVAMDTILVGSNPGTFDGSVLLGDYDNDNDLDLVITGNYQTRIDQTLWTKPKAEIYRNEGAFQFVASESGLANLWYSHIDWADYDNDNDLDLFLTGTEEDNDARSYLYLNDGNDQFGQSSLSFGNENGSIVQFVDFDNDGDKDVFICGHNFTRIYINGEDGDIIELQGIFWKPGAVWGDFDNDGDLDLILSGQDYGHNQISNLYLNNFGSFLLQDIDLINLVKPTLSASDFDSDGDLDLAVAGKTSEDQNVLVLYTNQGCEFEEYTTLEGVDLASLTWLDYDNDGDLDLLIGGLAENYSGTIKLYSNSAGNFTEELNVPFRRVNPSSISCGDMDNDGDSDLAISMKLYPGQGIHTSMTILYENTSSVQNTPPEPPSNLGHFEDSSGVWLAWNDGLDIETPYPALGYNLYIGSEAGSVDIVAPESDLESGYRQIGKQGNAGQNNSWPIRGLEHGTYYWSVQTLDNMNSASAFAPEKTFHVNVSPSEFLLTSPDSGFYNLDQEVLTFHWQASSDPDNDEIHYGLIIESSNGVEVYISSQNDSLPLSLTNLDLPKEEPLLWYVFATDNMDTTWSNRFTITLAQTLDIGNSTVALPERYIMVQNYPNPFNPSTTIRYGLPEESNVALVIYDIRGNIIQTLSSGHQSAGWYDVTWNGETVDGKSISTGIYFARLVSGDYSQVVKMLYLK